LSRYARKNITSHFPVWCVGYPLEVRSH
jgi:hypothetical protein